VRRRITQGLRLLLRSMVSASRHAAGPRNDIGVQIGDVSVRAMTCSAGLRAISNSKLLRSGDIATPGFYCYTLKRFIPAGYDQPLGANVRCVSGARAFRFGWAT
jgi:hypothetical protein